MFKVGDKVTWNVYGWHTGTVIGIIENDYIVPECKSPLRKKGDLRVLCNNPHYASQVVTLSPDGTVKHIN